MKILHPLLFGLLLVPAPAFSADEGDLTAASIPHHVKDAFDSLFPLGEYTFSAHLNPFFIQGDFNGDGKLDAAILVQEKASRKQGVAVVHRGSPLVSILGAGQEFGNGGDDFSWLDAWHTFPKATVGQGAAGGEPPPKLCGDAIMVAKTMSASALIYWTGKNYAWYQQGD